MKNRTTIGAALALGTVLGAAATLLPHAAAAPAPPIQQGTVDARLNALETQVKQLKAEYVELKTSGVKTTIYEVAPSTAAPNPMQAFPFSPYSNIPPYNEILLRAPAH